MRRPPPAYCVHAPTCHCSFTPSLHQVRITPLTTKRIEHSGIKVQLLGQIELASERGSPHDFVSLGAYCNGTTPDVGARHKAIKHPSTGLGVVVMHGDCQNISMFGNTIGKVVHVV